MATTDGARSAGDPVLEGAISEMSSEGTLDATGTFDPGDNGASQVADGASAANAGALPAPGDDGSDTTGRSSTPNAPLATQDPSAAQAAADPLAGTEPFTYTVNGEQKTLAGVYRVPGEGLLVPEDQVSSLQQVAERADVLDRVTRELTAQNTTYERLSAWNVTDPDGTQRTLSGQQGLEAMRVELAQQAAAISAIDVLLSDPQNIVNLLVSDGQGGVTIDPRSLKMLALEVRSAAVDAERQERSKFATLGQSTSGPASSGSSGQDYTAQAPAVIKQAAGAAYDTLSADDRSLLADQLSRYVRPVTEEDRRWNPALKIGAPIVDASFTKVVQHLAAQRQASSKVAEAAERAGKFNGGQDRGRQPAKPTPKPAAPIPPADGRKPKADWDSPLTEALAEMGVSR